MGKNYSRNLRSITNTGNNLTMTQMFDISEKLVSEQADEIFGVKTINWEDSSWKYLSLLGDEQVITLQHTKVYVFSDSVLCFGKMNENPRSNTAWEERLAWFKSSSEYRALDTVDGEPMEFEWNIFPAFTTRQLVREVQELLLRLSKTPENLTRRIIFFVDDQRHFTEIKRQQDRNASRMLNSLFCGLGTEKKWYSISEEDRWDIMAEKMMVTLAQSFEPWVNCPEECSKAKAMDNCQ